MSDLFLALVALTVWVALTLDAHRTYPHVLTDDTDCLHSFYNGVCLFCGHAK